MVVSRERILRTSLEIPILCIHIGPDHSFLRRKKRAGDGVGTKPVTERERLKCSHIHDRSTWSRLVCPVPSQLYYEQHIFPLKESRASKRARKSAAAWIFRPRDTNPRGRRLRLTLSERKLDRTVGSLRTSQADDNFCFLSISMQNRRIRPFCRACLALRARLRARLKKTVLQAIYLWVFLISWKYVHHKAFQNTVIEILVKFVRTISIQSNSAPNFRWLSSELSVPKTTLMLRQEPFWRVSWKRCLYLSWWCPAW